MLRTFAPAKLNLYLHITGRRDNGYHELDSLVAFCDVGDELAVEEAEKFSLSIDGPFALSLTNEPVESNLIYRAAHKLAEAVGKEPNLKVGLVKNLPIASGIGGGSSDAAAVLRLLAQLWDIPPNDPLLFSVAKSLGQDIPCCIESKTCCFQGIGDIVTQGPELPPTAALLVNPHRALPTPSVYKARQGGFAQPAPFASNPKDAKELAAWLGQRHNGLTEAACSLVPEIKNVLLAIESTADCLLSRMSGSGATCFGLYADMEAARQARRKLFALHPNWWMVPTSLPFAPKSA
jgi:4-diphosphocytidyl-2-C-methyl-D-erythritol kinase